MIATSECYLGQEFSLACVCLSGKVRICPGGPASQTLISSPFTSLDALLGACINPLARIRPPSPSVAWGASRVARSALSGFLPKDGAKSLNRPPWPVGLSGDDRVAIVKTKPHDNANSLVEQQLDIHLDTLEQLLNADIISYDGPITYGVDDLIRDAVERVTKRRRKLVFILETSGGLADVTEKIAHTLRKFYRRVEVIVPNYAMS